MDQVTLLTHFTPERIRELSCDGNPLLTSIHRDETFAGKSLLRGGHVITRDRDYAVIVGPTINGCERGIRELGKRLEDCLAGRKRLHMDFASRKLVPGGVDPISRWEGRSVMLYSCGPVPQLLGHDGVFIIRCAGSADEVRFGYYGNTGPSEP